MLIPFAMASKKHVQLSEEEKFNLITLWEAEVVLYDVGNRDNNHNNNKRTAALQRISEVMDSETTVDDIKFYLRGLRTTYMKERRKSEDAKSSGSGRNEMYTPQWKFSFFFFSFFYSCYTRYLPQERQLWLQVNYRCPFLKTSFLLLNY